jgi:hypothetical protein
MRSARCKPRILSILCASLALAGTGAHADSPLGWVHTDHISAYTIDARTFELNLGAIAVNEDLDFLGIRDDLLAGTRQLEGDSGDLSGNNLELNVGITSWLSAYYRRQQSELVIDIGEVRSINLVVTCLISSCHSKLDYSPGFHS